MWLLRVGSRCAPIQHEHPAGRLRATRARSARALRAASSVLCSSIAIVIGPTPPGTGVIAPATSRAGLEVDVADEPVVGAVDPDVDDRRAGLDPIARDQPRAADRGDQDVGAAADRRRGRAVREWQTVTVASAFSSSADKRPADEDRAADDHRLGALGRRPRRRASSSITPAGVQGTRPGRPWASRPALAGGQPVDVLGRRRSRSTTASWSMRVGQRELDEDPVDLVGPR